MINPRKIAAYRQGARKSFPLFATLMRHEGFLTPFHLKYYWVLDAFAHGRIKRLIVSMPPQHGKSEGASRLLPAYLFGLNPDARVAIASYSDRFARKFSRDIQRIIEEPRYRILFPDTALSGMPMAESTSGWVRTANEFEIVGHEGTLTAVGRSGGLTGQKVDIAIMDDLYKNAMEANSPLIRDAVWDWYISVVRTRMHNDSRELIVFTRWNEDDLIGRITKIEPVIELKSLDQLTGHNPDAWLKLNFEAIKTGAPTELDPRGPGEALWPDRQSLKILNERRALSPIEFECMYQGNPSTEEGLLYGKAFQTYTVLPAPNDIIKKANYTDTADMGEDFLCSVCYVVGRDGFIYVTDILYTQDSMEVTEPATAKMLAENDTRIAYIESNNGGRGFARAVAKLAPQVRISWFHQSGNKEARILTNAASVLNSIKFPENWAQKWPSFYFSLTTYRREFKANKNDDAPDVLTGIIEKEIHKPSIRVLKTSLGHLPR